MWISKLICEGRYHLESSNADEKVKELGGVDLEQQVRLSTVRYLRKGVDAGRSSAKHAAG